MKTQISIIGCGWLGLPLAKKLVEDGFYINGSTTSKDKLGSLKVLRINPFLIGLTESEILGDAHTFLAESDTVIINIPPGLRKDPTKNHVAEIRNLITVIEQQSVNHVLYISSTSVFEDSVNFPIIKAETQPNGSSNSAKQLIEIEHMLQNNKHFKTTILRFGGLIDDNRHPGKFLSGRAHVSNPDAPINLIHQTDSIHIILAILKQNVWKVEFNAAYPKHPTKKDYYNSYCQSKNLPLPAYNSSDKSKGKIIDSTKVVQLLNYSFQVVP
ncbi:MAG: NAD(P)H-binding protein [Winogradskyella sp.]|uniref:NAD(P)H-binding protein n=1 Tax=Winogradskyella sp. TaxID=1883156 RepID=UPI0038584348